MRDGSEWGWTDERRAKQAGAIRRWQPWNRATGPRTAEGKAISSQNASKPNSVRQQLLAMRVELKEVMRQVKAMDAQRRLRHQRKVEKRS